jgi:hypothetical protein
VRIEPFQRRFFGHPMIGPLSVLLLVGLLKALHHGGSLSEPLDTWDVVWAIVVLIGWLRWNAEKEFEYLRDQLQQLRYEIDRLVDEKSE